MSLAGNIFKMAARGFLVRRAKKTNNTGHKSAKAHRKKKLPPWDNSISNLLVHKPTTEELKRRHELHQPVQRNFDSHDSSKQFPNGYHSGSEVDRLRTPESTTSGRFSVLREIMDSSEKLQDALTYSDKRLSAVKDLFGDDPKKFRGFPNITSAPSQNKSRDSRERTSAVAFMKEPSLGASSLDILSDTIMDGTALNDVPDLNKDTGDENNNVEDDLKFNTSARTNSVKALSKSESVTVTHDSSAAVSTHHPGCTSPSTKAKSDITKDETYSSVLSSSRSTLLAGAPNMREHSRQPRKQDKNSPVAVSEEQSPSSVRQENKYQQTVNTGKTRSGLPATTFQGLHDLRQMVDNLEDEVRKYEEETGREITSPAAKRKGKESFGGFTVSILNAVTKLVGYLRDSETQRKADLVMKEDIILGFQQQQFFIDALTNDLIQMQEENKKLRNVFETYKKGTEDEIVYLKREMYAVLKSHEYHTMSKDVDFLYDPEHITDNSLSKNPALEMVTEGHGLRDQFEYLPKGTAYEDATGRSPRRRPKQYDNETFQVTSVQQDPGTTNEYITTERAQQNAEIVSLSSKDNTPESPQANIGEMRTSVPMNLGPVRTGTAQNEAGKISSRNYESVPHRDQHFSSPFVISHNVTATVPNDQRPARPRTLSPSTAVPSQDNAVSLQPSVFLGRNQSMSPHRYSSTVSGQSYEKKAVPSNSSSTELQIRVDTEKTENSPVEDSAKSLFQKENCSDHDVKRRISLTYGNPTEDTNPSRQSNSSPRVSPIFYERRPYQASKTTGEKMIVTLPSMWEDADTGPEKPAVRESTSYSAVQSHLQPNGKLKTDQGWFALSSHMAN